MERIDFLPDRVRQQRRRRQSLRRQAVGVAICTVILGGLAWLNQARVADARQQLCIQAGQRQALQGRKNMIASLQAQLEGGAIKSRIGEELGSRLDVNAVLAELGRLLPSEASLTSLECSTVEFKPVLSAAVALTGAPKTAARAAKPAAVSEARMKVILTGIAPTGVDVAQFVGQLSACPLFEDVQMGYDKTIEIDNRQRRARSFQVTCLLVR